MHTQNVNTAASESSKTWINGPKVCVSANDLRMRWHTTGEDGKNVTPSEGKHYPARNGSYGTDVLLLDADPFAGATSDDAARTLAGMSVAATFVAGRPTHWDL